jgi:hypothetical protein
LSFDTFDELIWLLMSRVPPGSALGSDHSEAAVAVVVVAVVDVVDCVTGAVDEEEDVELDVLLDDLWLLPPHAAIATLATTVAATVAARHSRIPLIVRPLLG